MDSFDSEEFVTEDNLLQNIPYLDHELSSFGFQSIILPEGLLNSTNLVNASYKVIQLYRRLLMNNTETKENVKKLENENIRLQHIISQKKEELANKDKDLKSAQIEESHLNRRLNIVEKKLKAEQEKYRKLSCDMQSRDTIFKHERKKKCQEVEKLQAKLAKMLQDKRQDRMHGIEIVNALQRSDGSRAKWQTEKTKKENENNMYQTVISNYEDVQKELLKENHEMRQTLKKYQHDLLQALNRQTSDETSSKSSCDSAIFGSDGQDLLNQKTTSSPTDKLEIGLSDDVFNLPYGIIKDDVEAQFSCKWEAIKRKVSDETSKLNHGSGDNLAALSKLNQIITEQQKIIDYLTDQGDFYQEGKHTPDDVYFLEEKSEFEKHKVVFKQQQELLKTEKAMYTEALIKLGEDRQAFEAEKGSYLQNQFLQMTPFRTDPGVSEDNAYRTDQCISSEERGVTEGNSFSESNRNCEQQMRNGYFSPNIIRKTPCQKKNMPPLPSTVELYRALGLSSCKSKQQISEHLFACKKQLRMGEY